MLIREKDKQLLHEHFKTISVPVEIWAYGSRVNGDAHDASDIDLVLRTQTLEPLPNSQFIQLTENIRDSIIPVLVELRDWALLPSSFHTQIQKQYEVFFTSLPQ